jgi:sarcosine dehydrogenase
MLRFVGRRFYSSGPSLNLPAQVDVVVVGGGSIGGSTLYHLQKLGVHAILLERAQLTSGTTWHSAGMLWRLRPVDTDIELVCLTFDIAFGTTCLH